MYAYRTPGVYFEWIDDQQPPIQPLRTDIAGFVGIAERGPLHTPVKVESWAQFSGNFGGYIPQGFLAYGVRGFFENGGRTCWIVRVADPDYAREGFIDCGEPSPSGRVIAPAFRLIASSPGDWGTKLLCSIVRTSGSRFLLTLQLPDGTREMWRDLTLDPADSRYVKTVLNDPQNGSRLVTVAEPNLTGAQCGVASEPISLQGGMGFLRCGRSGLATLRPEHFSGESSQPDKPWGLAALAPTDEVSIVAAPDIMPKPVVFPPIEKPQPPRCDALGAELAPPSIPEEPPEFPPQFSPQEIVALQAALIRHCENLKDRMAILDSPDRAATAEVIAWRKNFTSKYAALYYPWLLAPDPLELEGLLRAIPPSGHVAGIYARGDQRVGVHKPPANEVVELVNDVRTQIDDVVHGFLNDEAVNVIRPYNGRGIRVAGARTLSNDLDWRYVNVRRLMTMIEEAIDESTQWTVFEPNNPDLWRDIERVARSFLDRLWSRGMLDGATAEEAYFARCDETTNPPEETGAGRVICLVGVRPPWPAEFLVVRIGKTQGGTEITELNGGRNA